jgi:hypothetical protein
MIIPFPFSKIDPVAPHVRNLGFFVWKPIVIQVRFLFFIKNNLNIRFSGCSSTFWIDHLW